MAAETLPEVSGVSWRPRMDDARLRLYARAWTATTAAHVVPFVVTAAVLVLIEPWLAPMSALALVQAWVIPELYANRGAKLVRPKRRQGEAAERTALGLLGDLLDHDGRELHARTGLALEPGRFGTWLVGEAGALLVRPNRRTVHCFCVRVNDPDLPSSDRISHLLLALRSDEAGFATVANQGFAGARWRVRRRLPKRMRPALDAAARHAGQQAR
ncbi:MAG: hypothetical protein AVDCRST_MAG85-2640 [uncultured Solirubrobacteraceae bacterium]|uniref:Uncharacterized protein n=1 Tax=uncultured Solirubrobacteraceae bacterium TaxID=1162706 RepID=A0A6J4T963_9ACTN|nr:MAG: hypothetical protein AVDCRST_MAG85-2640 [uncultured Solirubrobacteraceae bacterium]